MSILYLLSKRHRIRNAQCSICRMWRYCAPLKSTADWTSTDAKREVIHSDFYICGPCGREIARVADEGRKARK
jgi:hypothetical protein